MRTDTRSHVVLWRRWSAWKPERRILSWAGLGLLTAYGALGWWEASIVIAGVALTAAAVPSSRALIAEHLGRIQARRRTSCALLDAMAERAPFVGWMGEVPVGEMLVATVCNGGDVPEVQRAAPPLAAALRAREVRIHQRDADALVAEMLVVRREPLGEIVLRDFRSEECSLHDFVPLGTDEDGFPVTVGLVGHHLLIGGEPGAGKSGTVLVVLAAAALDGDCEIWCFDGKRVEPAAWAPLAKRMVGPDMAEAIAALDELRAEMDWRYDRLFQQNKRKVARGDGTRTLLVVIDARPLRRQRRQEAGPGVLRAAPRRRRPGTGSRHRRRRRNTEALRRPSAVRIEGQLRLSDGAPLCHTGGVRHHPRLGLVVRGLLGLGHRPETSRCRFPPRRGRRSPADADCASGRQGHRRGRRRGDEEKKGEHMNIDESSSHAGSGPIRGSFEAIARGVERTGGCARPIRLKATSRNGGYSSAGEPDGVLLIACRTRRESRCPPCAATFRGDARHLVLSGLEGGKGVPESVCHHPAVFLTLTAPSFGPVHRAVAGPCRGGGRGAVSMGARDTA